MESVSYHIGESDYISFMRMFAVRALPRSAMFIAGVVVVVALVAISLGKPEAGISAAISAVVTLVVFSLLGRYLIIPRKGARTFRDYALIREEMTLTLSENGFAIAQASGHVAMAWGNVLMWDETDQILAIHPTRELAYILPKRAIGTEREDFIRQQLVAHGLLRKGKGRK